MRQSIPSLAVQNWVATEQGESSHRPLKSPHVLLHILAHPRGDVGLEVSILVRITLSIGNEALGSKERAADRCSILECPRRHRGWISHSSIKKVFIFECLGVKAASPIMIGNLNGIEGITKS